MFVLTMIIYWDSVNFTNNEYLFDNVRWYDVQFKLRKKIEDFKMVVTTKKPENERINFRIPSDMKDVIEQASALEGIAVSAFIKRETILRALEVVREHKQMHLTKVQSEQFYNVLSKPAEPNEKLRSAIEEHEALVTSI